jgi:hypothetical protein
MLNRRVIALFLFVAMTQRVRAGMTTYDLNDVVRLRLEDISFFAALLLGSGFLIRILWNVLARGVPSLPRLPYKQALALTVILSLGVLLVLSMISGARELLTPAAWRRQGSAYKLNAPENEPGRLRNMAALKAALFEHAERNNGRFPAHDWGPEIPQKIWEAESGGTHFIYFGGFNTNLGTVLIAAEPISFGESRYVLTANGEIRKLAGNEIAKAMLKGGGVQ